MKEEKKARYAALREALSGRILVLDGSLGAVVQRMSLTENTYRGRHFATHSLPLSGNVDVLCLTASERISAIHRAYLDAGADIIETNTFNANALSQSRYGLVDDVRALNMAGAEIARAEADKKEQEDPSRLRFVAGSMGPTAKAASLPDDVADPTHRAVTFEELSGAAYEQALALIDGGVDLILLETCFDALNIKAQLHGIRRAAAEREADIPLFVSITVSDASGRILSGHTPEAILAVVEEFAPDALGFNCGSGAASLAGALRALAAVSPYPTIFYPNAGMPDSLGNYSQTAEQFAMEISPLFVDGMINVAGGCCGTDDAFIGRVAALAEQNAPRKLPEVVTPWLSGIDAFYDNRGFINVGERCNVAGSRKFLRLITEKNSDEALAIAHKQVLDGAMMLDINVDDGMLDSVAEMRNFLRLLGSDPVTSSVPWMVDSSSFDVIVEALKNIPGKPVVNSISLKHGEEEFLRQARVINGMGAAVVVMAFDEDGQADTYERKIQICSRAYKLLTDSVGMAPRDIIFDPNVLTVATGMPEHDRYGIDFIRAVEWIKTNLPGAKTSGGISNLSFAFRGNNYVRQAMHAVFLYHAIRAGLDMAIMDPGARVTYDAIPAPLLQAIEDVILCRCEDATQKLTSMVPEYSAEKPGAPLTSQSADVERDVDTRLADALQSGDASALEADLVEAVERHGSANAVVEGPLMAGMERVGQLFESGRMFLPQVVKSARVMHQAVEILRPMLESGAVKGSSRGLFLTATVKGDVHDIGKNIVNVVMRCNNYEVVDLGVQVEADRIVAEALRLKPDFIGLSGLISPSLDEMANVASALRRAGVRVPLFVGGAATSELHTALKIAPEYDGVVVRVADASQNPVVAGKLLKDKVGESSRIADEQHRLRAEYEAMKGGNNAEQNAPTVDWEADERCVPSSLERYKNMAIPVSEVRQFINWIYFANCWKTPLESAEGKRLRAEAEAIIDDMEAAGCEMSALAQIFPASGSQERQEIVVGGCAVPVPRQNATRDRAVCLSLADYVAPEGYGDHVGAFVVTIGEKIRRMVAGEGEEYRRLLMQSVCDRLAEAASEWLHFQVRTRLWGYASDEVFDEEAIRAGRYCGIRPAVGYPSLPDQAVMHTVAQLLHPEDIGVSVTENGALSPASSVAGFYIASPRARYFTR